MRTLGYLAFVGVAALFGAACSSSDSSGGSGGASGGQGGTGNATSGGGGSGGATAGGGSGGATSGGGSAGSPSGGGSGGATSGGGSAGSPSGGGSGGATAGGGSGGATSGGGSGGATSGGGSGGSGGTAIDYVCGATGGTLGSCESSGQFDTCGNCIKSYCCSQRQACLAKNPNDPCGYGGPSGFISEAQCFQKCFKTQTAGGASTQQAHATCSVNCVSPGCTAISTKTTALMSCLQSYCLSQCLT